MLSKLEATEEQDKSGYYTRVTIFVIGTIIVQSFITIGVLGILALALLFL